MDKDIKEKIQQAAELLLQAEKLAYERGKSSYGYRVYSMRVKIQELAPKE